MKRELCLAAVMVAGVVAMGAQDAPVPPAVKMGLWQNTATNTMTGLQIPPDVAAKLQAMGKPVPGSTPRTIVTQSCLTPDKWQKSFADMQQNKNCQFTNVHQSAKGMSGDMVCTTPGGASKGTWKRVCEPGEDEREDAHGGHDGAPVTADCDGYDL